ncbi:LPS translocon maturation chaperone LptM [Massilia glaciei]|uniref:LPS translocon maturation chaperone LptM n=1 Tax=Massilia glaciei TaxID=1524097 RepID=UPI001C62A5B8|nr:lipoprotein [Massilia glaciei]
MVLAATAALAGCGQPGPLTMPNAPGAPARAAPAPAPAQAGSEALPEAAPAPAAAPAR